MDQGGDTAPPTPEQRATAAQSLDDSKRREQLPALHLNDVGTVASKQPDNVRPQRVKKKLDKFE